MMLKRRREKLEPRRKLEGLNRNVLPPQCERRLERALLTALFAGDAVDLSRVATAAGVFVTGSVESCVIALSPQKLRSV